MLKEGGLWIFDNEIASVSPDAADGGLVLVRDFDGYPMGTGFYNSRSKIAIRILSRGRETEIDEAFLQERVRAAWEYRKKQ